MVESMDTSKKGAAKIILAALVLDIIDGILIFKLQGELLWPCESITPSLAASR
jgi:hypothetical protein